MLPGTRILCTCIYIIIYIYVLYVHLYMYMYTHGIVHVLDFVSFCTIYCVHWPTDRALVLVSSWCTLHENTCA